jgi:hypothetical protein
MIRTIFVPESNSITFPIPDKYVGKKLEITVFSLNELSITNPGKEVVRDIDPSFGAWADMDKSTEELCTQIRSSRTFRKKEIVL